MCEGVQPQPRERKRERAGRTMEDCAVPLGATTGVCLRRLSLGRHCAVAAWMNLCSPRCQALRSRCASLNTRLPARLAAAYPPVSGCGKASACMCLCTGAALQVGGIQTHRVGARTGGGSTKNQPESSTWLSHLFKQHRFPRRRRCSCSIAGRPTCGSVIGSHATPTSVHIREQRQPLRGATPLWGPFESSAILLRHVARLLR